MHAIDQVKHCKKLDPEIFCDRAPAKEDKGQYLTEEQLSKRKSILIFMALAIAVLSIVCIYQYNQIDEMTGTIDTLKTSVSQKNLKIYDLEAKLKSANEQVYGGSGSSSSTYVWIPKSGSKYHSSSSCSNMKNPSCVTKKEAAAFGYTKCSKCW